MGKRKSPWQDVDYVLGYFGRTAKGARKAYIEYAGVGITQGRREDLTGGDWFAVPAGGLRLRN
ncbi:MAG: hypothetical protein K9N21_12770 [Deltaproteobacteria bacterium]|nr:hypothetical protein [Deltaproteobacteria bacterium]